MIGERIPFAASVPAKIAIVPPGNIDPMIGTPSRKEERNITSSFVDGLTVERVATIAVERDSILMLYVALFQMWRVQQTVPLLSQPKRLLRTQRALVGMTMTHY